MASRAIARLSAGCVMVVACGLVLLGGCRHGARESFRAQYQRAAEAQRTGRRTEAIAAYREALRLRPDSAEAHNDLGVALYGVGEREAAIQEYHRALRLNPDYSEAHNNLGVALLSKGQIAAAVGHYRKAVERKPEFAAARYNLCLGLELLHQLPEALAHCRVVAAHEPGRPGVTDAVERLKRKLAIE